MISLRKFCQTNNIQIQVGKAFVEAGIIKVTVEKVNTGNRIYINPKEIDKLQEGKHFVVCPSCKEKMLCITKTHFKKCPSPVEEKYSEFFHDRLMENRADAWADSEKNLLKEIYEDNSEDFIVLKFPDRTWRSIREMAIRMGLRRKGDVVQQGRLETLKENTQKKYGVDSTWQLDSVKEKSKQTNRKRRGTDFPLQSPEVKEKVKQAVRAQYGVDNVFQAEEIKEKIRSTNLERYGAENPNQNPEVRKRSMSTNEERYGVENPFQMVDRVQKGMMEKYGATSPQLVREIRERTIQTNIARYGSQFPTQNEEIRKKLSIILQSPEVKEKKYQAFKNKKSFFSSAEEDNFLKYLKQIDSHTKPHRLHPTTRFIIDYYMPTLDLWVQYDGVYWHGKDYKEDPQGYQNNGIKRMMENDRIQNENIPNLIRFWSDEAIESIKNETVVDLIKKRVKEKMDSLKKDPFYIQCHQYKKKMEHFEDDLKTLPFNPENVKASDFNLSPEPLSFEIEEFIKKYEWLGTLGSSPKWCFTARYKGFLGGTILINEPTAYSTILGKDTQIYEALIQRGATASWTPKNLGSRFVMFSCKWMVLNTEKRAFVGYADPAAQERGIIYRACNFDYLGDSFGSTHLYRHPQWENDFSSQDLKRTSAFRKWCRENNIEIDKSWFKENGIKNLETIPIQIKTQWYEWIKKILSESEKIKIPSKMKYVLVLGKDRREKNKMDSLKTYTAVPYFKENILGIKPLPPKIKTNRAVGKTRDRKNKIKIQFIIDNYGRMSRIEMAKELNETKRWVKRQLRNLTKQGIIKPIR